MAADVHNYITPKEACLYNTTIPGDHCNATWDGFLCWPPTPAGEIAEQGCPYIYGAGPDMRVYKTCGSNGHWAEPASFKHGAWKSFGDSDHSECIAHHMNNLKSEEFDVPAMFTYAPVVDKVVPVLDITRMSLLVIALLSMAAACVVMRCIIPQTIQQVKQYRILRHLFAAVIFEAIFNLLPPILSIIVIYQSVTTKETQYSEPVICELFISLSKYSNMAVCTWLLLQSHHLLFVVTSGQLCTLGYVSYCLIGWGIPLIPTVVWVVTLSFSHKVTCWTGYTFMDTMLITEAPKGLILCIALSSFAKTTWILAKDSERRNKSCCFRRVYHNSIISLIYCLYMVISFFTSCVMNNLAPTDLATLYVTSVPEDAKGLVLTMLFLGLNSDIWKFVLNLRRISTREPVSVIEDSEV